MSESYETFPNYLLVKRFTFHLSWWYTFKWLSSCETQTKWYTCTCVYNPCSQAAPKLLSLSRSCGRLNPNFSPQPWARMGGTAWKHGLPIDSRVTPIYGLPTLTACGENRTSAPPTWNARGCFGRCVHVPNALLLRHVTFRKGLVWGGQHEELFSLVLPIAVRASHTVTEPRGAMAKSQPLKLSDLKSSTDYPMGNSLSDGRCLIHVKLTDPCVKSIESLINSDKVDHTAVQSTPRKSALPDVCDTVTGHRSALIGKIVGKRSPI